VYLLQVYLSSFVLSRLSPYTELCHGFSALVRPPVRAPVRAHVCVSVRAHIRVSVRAPVRVYVHSPVRAPVRVSVRVTALLVKKGIVSTWHNKTELCRPGHLDRNEC
jgi:hypothetical protein